MKPIVAVVGRPNVGKSTLFNRITRSRDALVDDFPGVTRDRNFGDAVWDEVAFTVVDTGGYGDDRQDDFAAQIRFQVEQAIDDADAIVLLMDGKGGLSPFDRDLTALLREVPKPLFFAVNKVDGVEKEDLLFDFYSLGVDKLYPLSAAHGYGVPDLLDDLVARFPRQSEAQAEDMIRVAVVGRPNAGKSSLINRLLGKERLVVSDRPGTTRDSIDSVCRAHGKSYLLIDTAGIRRKKKVGRKLEKFSIIKALKSLDRCDVALLMLDADEGVTEQDVTIAGYAYERGCGVIFLFNKWDLVAKDTHSVKRFVEALRDQAKFLSFAPALTISALSGQRVAKIFKLVEEVYAQYGRRLGTGEVNRIVERATAQNEPSLHRGRRIKFFYSTQVTTKPPTFVCFVNYPQAVHFSYKRYLTNKIREAAELDKTPLRIYFRERSKRMVFDKKPQGPQTKKRTRKK